MKDSNRLQRKQTTKELGYLEKIQLETGSYQGTRSNYSASPKRERENDVTTEASNLLEDILSRENMTLALKQVTRNKGSHGVDGMKYDELRNHIIYNWSTIKAKLLEGKYTPSPVRRVEIPKPNGDKRLLGIPTVQDRMIQQAIAQKLNEIYDTDFSESSYGFRPKRSAQQAILKAKEYINEGYKWVVDMDLEKFFDKVNHDILMERLSRKVKDKRVLKLIRKYLESGILINGIKVNSPEGTPQGGPLSPLLSNILLDELDKELEKRGHKFCRYADDCNIYVASRKAGERVLVSIKKLLEQKLKLKINEKKSEVDLVSRRKFLGFSFYFRKGGVEIRIHEKSYQKLKMKLKELSNRNTGISMEMRMNKINQVTTGWLNYFKIAKAKGALQKIEKWLRRRLRTCIWKQWKKIKTKQRNLVKLGAGKREAWKHANTRKGYWRISNSLIINRTLNNQYLENIGYKSITKRYQLIH